MRYILTLFTFLAFSCSLFSQERLDRTLRKLNEQSVPYIHIGELLKMEHPVLLDTRKKEEYNISHLKNAIWGGFKKFSIDSIYAKIPNKNQEIIVYCSIGIRSEDIGEKLTKAGYTNVKNLYGGIFEWKNNNLPIYDTQEKETEKIHAFNKFWGKLLTKGEKIY